jgi:predicted enzyme related to lactoylglutathione lyase
MTHRCRVAIVLGVVAAAVIYVNDLPRMRSFYETCFSLLVVQPVEDDVNVLLSDDWDLSLVAMPEEIAARVIISTPPERRTVTPIKLAFEVKSHEDLRPTVIAAGGQMDPPQSAWEFRGHRHLDCVDPEGNLVQLRQPVAD